MLQAALSQCVLLSPFSLFQNCFVAFEVDIRWRDVVQALMIALVVVVIHEGFDVRFKIPGQEVVFEQDAVFKV